MKNFPNKQNLQKGQSLIELLVTIAIAAILFPALITGLIASRNGKAQENQRTQAVVLLKQTQEIIRVIREKDWTTFATDGTFHPVSSGNTWSLSSGADNINGLIRQIVISDVYRDSNRTIVTLGGTIDPSTKKLTTTVSWNSPLTSSVTASSFITRFANQNYRETTQAQFNLGKETGTTVTNTSGGEVILGSGGSGDWCNPGTSVVSTYTLTGGVAKSISATSSATQDFAYTTTGDNASGHAVDEFTISHASPPVIANPNFNNEAKAYGIYVDNANNYVYFNENKPPNHTIRILQGSTLNSAGYFDTQSNGTGSSVYVLGNIGYTTVGSKLYLFDVSTIKGTSSQTQINSVNLSGTGKRVVVVGNNAYVATSSTTNQLQIFNISNPNNIPLPTNISLENNQAGVDVFVNSSQTFAYVVTTYASGNNDFFIVDLVNKNSDGENKIYGYTTNGMNPNGTTVVPGNRAIVVGSGGKQYQVFNITNPANAIYCGGISPGTNSVNAVAPILDNNGNAFSYILADNSTFQILLGGPGGQFTNSGIFESQTFTATTEAMFNYFNTTVSIPSQSSLSFKVAIKHAVNGSCSGITFADADFVGTDGTSGTYFPSSGGLLPASSDNIGYENPGRCLRYRAYLSTTDTSQSPVLYDLTFNYSP